MFGLKFYKIDQIPSVLLSRYFSTNSSVDRIKTACRNILSDHSNDQVLQESKKFVQIYENLGVDEKSAVLSFLAKEYVVDHDKIKNAIAKYEINHNAFPDLHSFTQPYYYTLLKSIGNLPNGVKFVCNFRAELHHEIKSKTEDLLLLRRLDNAAKDLLTIWFCNSNLRLERLTWKSPADILQKVAQKEAVHPIQGLLDIQRRVGPCRRCFIFMHESMPREPLVIV